MRYLWSLLVLSMLMLPQVAWSATQQAVLSWTDLPNETSYVIERKIGPTGTYAQVGTTLTNIITFTDPALTQGTNYCWHVAGINTVGAGPFSDDACMSTVGIPGKVGGLTVIIQLGP